MTVTVVRSGCTLIGLRLAVVAVFLAMGAGCERSRPSVPTPAPVVASRPLGSWTGSGNQTIGVHSETGRLVITWEVKASDEVAVFRLTLHSAVSGRPLHVIADQRGSGGGSVNVADDPRPFSLMVEASGVEWMFAVEELVAAAREQ